MDGARLPGLQAFDNSTGPPSVTWPQLPNKQAGTPLENHRPAKHFDHRVRLAGLINGRSDHVPDEKWVYVMDQRINC